MVIEHAKVRNKSGQGISEYASILAFVAILVALFLGFSSNAGASLSCTFSAVCGEVESLTTANTPSGAPGGGSNGGGDI